MHVEIQVALNFVISYLYNKLPRRRVNLFGEELEKALKDRFLGHWYPEKPFKGSAFRCLKTGDPIDAVLNRAARESGVPISDILENLPAELAVWVDPGEVSYRIGEKGAVKILYSESNDLHEDTCADREVTKTFNPEAQCFRPIDAVSNNLSQLCLSPKTSPQASPSTAATNSPPTATAPTNVPPPIGSNLTINNKQQLLAAISPAAPAATNAFLPRSQAPLTFTTATFAQTKFGSTKLKTSSKRSNSRMSPTEFSNYIKQRAMQQQLHHSHGHSNNAISSHLGPIGTASPSRSISPNPLTTIHQQQPSDSYYFPNNSGAGSANAVMSHYTPFNSGRNASTFDSPNFAVPSLHNNNNNDSHFGHSAGNIGSGKFGGAANFLDPHNFYGLGGMVAGGATNVGGNGGSSAATASSPIIATPGATVTGGGINGGSQSAGGSSPSSGGSSENSKLLDGLSSFYANAGPYQHMLVAN